MRLNTRVFQPAAAFAGLAIALTACGCSAGPGGQTALHGPETAAHRQAAMSSPIPGGPQLGRQPYAQSYGPAVRSQSPRPQGGPQGSGIQQVGGHHRGIVRRPVYEATIGQHQSQQTAHFDGHSGMGASEFPMGGASCPSGACPSGTCQPGFGCTPSHPKCVRDARSYSYSQPKNLSYPSQGATGGGVVYPYYTHKSPSDFFRQ